MEKRIQELLAKSIFNTKRKVRNNSIVEIANDISELSELMGGLQNVAESLNISSEMLGHFLKVKKLNVDVKQLVEERKIDSVTVVKYLSKFNEFEQIYIAKEIINGNLNSVELRFIYPLRNKLKELPIQEVVKKHLQSKNIKISKAIFAIKDNRLTVEYLKNIFSNIVGEENFISVTIENNTGTLKVTQNGEKKLRDSAKKENLTLKQFFIKIINEK